MLKSSGSTERLAGRPEPGLRSVCIVSYYSPPNDTVAAIRAAKMAKYLPHFGWRPVVVARRWFHTGKLSEEFFDRPNLDLYRDTMRSATAVLVDSRPRGGFVDGLYAAVREAGMRVRSRLLRLGLMSIRGALSTIQRLVEPFPDEFCDWSRAAVKAALRDDHVLSARVVWSSSPPIASHVVAGSIASRLNVPWVADFRDLWALRWAPWWRVGISLRRRTMKQIEQHILRRASALTTVSEPLAEQLRALHCTKRVVTIPNGFDPDDYGIAPVRKDRCFTIRYTGTVYPGLQSPELLFAALSRLIREGSLCGDDVRVEFYGCHDPLIKSRATHYGLDDLVAVLPRVPIQRSIQLQREATMLLLLNQCDGQSAGIYTGKLFEYVGARRPILAVPDSQTVVGDLLQQTGAGRACGTVEDVVDFLRGCYQTWADNGRHLPWTFDEKRRAALSRRDQAGTLGALLDRLVED